MSMKCFTAVSFCRLFRPGTSRRPGAFSVPALLLPEAGRSGTHARGAVRNLWICPRAVGATKSSSPRPTSLKAWAKPCRVPLPSAYFQATWRLFVPDDGGEETCNPPLRSDGARGKFGRRGQLGASDHPPEPTDPTVELGDGRKWDPQGTPRIRRIPR